MAFYSPRLPLKRDAKNGYILLDNLEDVIKQNFKMLVLTMPGERIMDPDFGVGLYQFLFELAPPYSDVEEKIYARIINQTKRYLPTVSVKDISFAYGESNNPLQENNTLYVRVEYYIKALNANDVLEVSINSNF
jgi:phage baseplate assembly protein W